MRRQIPVGLNVHTLIRLRITSLPQRRSAHLGYESADGRYVAGKSQTATTPLGLKPHPAVLAAVIAP